MIADSGLPAVPAGPALGLRRGKLLAGRPSGERLPFDVTEKRPEKLTWDHVRATLMVFPRMVSDVLACDAMLDDLVRFTARWRPDLVVWDALTYTGPVVAELCGAAHVRALFGPDHLARLRALFLRLSADRELVGYDDPVRQWLTDRLHRYDRGASFDEDMVLARPRSTRCHRACEPARAPGRSRCASCPTAAAPWWRTGCSTNPRAR